MGIKDKKRIAIYIDGSNFYFKLKSLGLKNLINFNFRGFVDWLVRDRMTISRRYYVGAIRAKENDKRGQELRQDQQRLFSHLTLPSQDFIIERGYLMESNGKYHEKGVDVKLAVDLLVGAYDDLYDVAVIISSDTDLIPAIQKVRYLKKEVEYIGFAHQPSLALQRYANLSRLIIKEELDQFIAKTLFE